MLFGHEFPGVFRTVNSESLFLSVSQLFYSSYKKKILQFLNERTSLFHGC